MQSLAALHAMQRERAALREVPQLAFGSGCGGSAILLNSVLDFWASGGTRLRS